jgi:hypothetical protein
VWIREKIQEVLRTSLSAVTAVFTGCLRKKRRQPELKKIELSTNNFPRFIIQGEPLQYADK